MLSLPGARRLKRELKQMSVFWYQSRQLRTNRSIIPEMARIENQLSKRGIGNVPKSKVAAAEKYLRNGDIVCIVSTWPRDIPPTWDLLTGIKTACSASRMLPRTPAR